MTFFTSQRSAGVLQSENHERFRTCKCSDSLLHFNFLLKVFESAWRGDSRFSPDMLFTRVEWFKKVITIQTIASGSRLASHSLPPKKWKLANMEWRPGQGWMSSFFPLSARDCRGGLNWHHYSTAFQFQTAQKDLRKMALVQGGEGLLIIHEKWTGGAFYKRSKRKMIITK